MHATRTTAKATEAAKTSTNRMAAALWPDQRVAVIVENKPSDRVPNGVDPTWTVLRSTARDLNSPNALRAFLDHLYAAGKDAPVDIQKAVLRFC